MLHREEGEYEAVRERGRDGGRDGGMSVINTWSHSHRVATMYCDNGEQREGVSDSCPVQEAVVRDESM